MASLQFLSPVAATRAEERPLAPRLDALAEARIGLLDNQKANAGELLAAVGSELTSRLGDVHLVSEKKIATSPSPPEVLDRLRTVDAVVLAIAD